MATSIGGSVLTLVDVAKRMDPDGGIAAIAELLSKLSPLASDMMWKEANQATSHRMTVRTSLPTPAWRQFNEGVQVSKSSTAQLEEALAMLEAYSEVDVDLAMLNGNTAEFRLSEAVAFLEGMAQEFEATAFGDATSLTSAPASNEFRGLTYRYRSTSGDTGENVILAEADDSSTDYGSIWIVGHGEEGLFGLYPKGSKAGLQHEDLGVVTVETSSGVGGSRMRAYQDRFQWKCGIGIRNWKNVVRIANIDRSDAVAGSVDIPDLLIKGLHRFKNLNGVKPVIYCDRAINQGLDLVARNDVIAGAGLKYENVGGQVVGSFRGVPIHVSDALSADEDGLA